MGCSKNCFLVITLFFIIFSFLSIISAVECGSIPTNGCTVTQNTTFVQGNYSLPNGINLEGDNIILDCNNAFLQGSGGSTFGILVDGDNDFNKIVNCYISNYRWGIQQSNDGIGLYVD